VKLPMSIFPSARIVSIRTDDPAVIAGSNVGSTDPSELSRCSCFRG
jgi:hypothetical protein